MNGIPKYLIYDARYRFDEDRATVYCTADTLEEARDDVKEYGDCVIVESETGEIIEN